MSRKKDEKGLREYLERECPHYLGARVVSMSYAGDFKFSLVESGEGGRVFVHRVVLSNGQIAFGTFGGIIPESSYSNVFHEEDAPNAETAARFHLYWEGVNRFRHIFEEEERGLERLADLLRIPERFRIKE